MLNLSQNGCSVWVTSSTDLALTPTVIALGKFDGIHRGHKRVIQPILSPQRRGQNLQSSTSRPYSTVVTFNPHPQEFFSGHKRALLTPLDEKVQQLLNLGVEQLVLLPFNRELSTLTPQEFVEKILIEQLQAQRISVGQDFYFGSQRTGSAEDLEILAAKYGIGVNVVPLETSSCELLANYNEIPISSSLIRQTLESGDIELANQLLGRCYTLTGTVVQGQQLGRSIGFPTANLKLPENKFLPSAGVYAVRVFCIDDLSDTILNGCWGAMNIGHRPTVNGSNLSVEVHLLDWSGELYGKKLEVQLEKFLRPEEKFSSLEALKTQIQLDCTAAKTFFSRKC